MSNVYSAFTFHSFCPIPLWLFIQLATPAAWVGPLFFRCHYLNRVGGRATNSWAVNRLSFFSSSCFNSTIFWPARSQRTIVGMAEPKIDDRAYYYDRFYRHGVFKSGCLRFTPDGYFRRHDDVLKRLPCLQLKFQNPLSIGMMADFSAQHACTRKFHMTSDNHFVHFHP